MCGGVKWGKMLLQEVGYAVVRWGKMFWIEIWYDEVA